MVGLGVASRDPPVDVEWRHTKKARRRQGYMVAARSRGLRCLASQVFGSGDFLFFEKASPALGFRRLLLLADDPNEQQTFALFGARCIGSSG